jgi:porphobilinogen deaminase
VPITTAGDRDRTRPFGQIGERGVFVKEIEEALLAGASTSPSTRRRT